MKKSLFPLLIGWFAGSFAAATWILLMTGILDFMSPHPRLKSFIDILPGFIFWLPGVAIAMFPGLLVGGYVYFFTNRLRGPLSCFKSGLWGVATIWIWSLFFGSGFKIIEGYQVALFLGSGAFVAAYIFWFATLKTESRTRRCIQRPSGVAELRRSIKK